MKSTTANKPARKPRRNPPPPQATFAPPPAPAQGASYEVKLSFRVDGQLRKETFLLDDRRLYPEAKRWNYVVRNRERLTDQGRASSSEAAITRLADVLGAVAESAQATSSFDGLLHDMARAGLVEVTIPGDGGRADAPGYAARVFPWEMVITFLTWRYRTPEQRLAVVRHIASPDEEAWPGDAPETLLAASCAPGKIADAFNLFGECQLIAGILDLPPCTGVDEVLKDPIAKELSRHVAAGEPGILHLTGVDPGYLEVRKPAPVGKNPSGFGASPESPARDGLVLADAVRTYDPVCPQRLAELVTAGGHQPYLVSVSTCYSGRHTASRIVCAGAHGSIGFQDTVTDAAAEAFFSAFYRLWRNAGWPHPATVLLESICQATDDPGINLTGGVVVWSRHSVFTTPSVPKTKKAGRAQHAAVPQPVTSLHPRRNLEVIFDTVDTLNYSLLHNRRSLFKEFRVRKYKAGQLPDLTIEVALDAGGTSLPCRFTCPLPEEGKVVDLLQSVSTPLVAPLLRRVSESLRSNVYLRVSCEFEGKQITLCETTRPITILPVDEWRDDGKDHCWLPSFVLPRDPAVLKIITAALRYLRAIADDPQAGFSGYQGIAADASNAADIIDPQVRAIWAALQHEFRLAYINPPPSYTVQAQRLRSPTQILAGGAATCIDLALLFAACLEYIGVFPAIFLIQGHCFPGYWRDDTSWFGLQDTLKETDDVVAAEGMPELEMEPPGPAALELGQKWMLSGVEHFPALAGYIRAQSLIPLESTFVTANRSFAEAQAQGRDNLQPRTFDAMVDVGLARRGGVTPLPILES